MLPSSMLPGQAGGIGGNLQRPPEQNSPSLIVSSINSPLYNLASWLHKIMYDSFPKPNSHIANSFDLVNKLSNLHIDNDYELFSLDVISLFTNIPINLAVESISKRWQYITNNCNIPESEFLTAINLVLNSTYFVFNNKFYQQTFGTPMGSPLSPIIADIVLQDIEEKALTLLNFTPPIYFRYVDDILISVPPKFIDETLTIFNSSHNRV
ncbi:uncharacterized protein [Anoplolepis gracilipes]|uniref:uncharacterized protein n=1 Tax=Anoplolepis gracilipes TaxID=354296 RepID=UPI003BA0C6BD